MRVIKHTLIRRWHMANLPNLVPYKALGNTTYSSDPKPYMNNKNKPLWDDFDSLIEQAVVHQKASLYSDLNEEMKWALGIAALRENKERVIIDRVYEKAVQYAVGDQKTLNNRRSVVFERFRKLGVGHTKIFRFFNKNSIEEFTLADLENLIGIGTSIKEGWLEIDKAFVLDEETTPLNVEERVKNLLNNEIKN